MFIDPAECIKNLFETEPKTYILFRGFGLNSPDRVGAMTREDVRRQLSAYYPTLRARVTRRGTGFDVEVTRK